MNGTSKAKTPSAYIASLPKDRRAIVEAVHSAIEKAVPELSPSMQAGMIGYGTYRYRAGTRDREWPIVALANQKNYVSVYICAGDEKGYLAETNKARLGKVSVGKSCIRFKAVEDIDLTVLAELAKKASKIMRKMSLG